MCLERGLLCCFKWQLIVPTPYLPLSCRPAVILCIKKICWLQIGHKKTYIFKDEHVVFLPKHDSSKILKIYDSQI